LGKGSLGACLRVKGPRLIVFEVGGLINLEGKGLTIEDPDVFIAGQTAPEPGITLIRGGLAIESDRTVLQHLRVRPETPANRRKAGGLQMASPPAAVPAMSGSITAR